MIFALFVLLIALVISAVAAYYSIAGLTAIFAAAVTPIIIMGAALEVGKITATVWLHKYWREVSFQFKLYLIPAIIILMMITSMGIFGYLSKAHMDQAIPAGDIVAQVELLDEKIKTERDNIEANKHALQQMDAQVDQMLGRTTDAKGASSAVQVRKNQAKERKQLQDDIALSQKNIAQIQNERAPIAAQVRKVEAEVGPIKYIASLVYGDNPDANLLERAVRWVIVLLVFVFDPLAIVLILAADQTIFWHREKKEQPIVPIIAEPSIQPEPIDSQLVDDMLDEALDAMLEDITASEMFHYPTEQIIKEVVVDDHTEINQIRAKLEETEHDLANAVLLIQEKQDEIDRLNGVTQPVVFPDNSQEYIKYITNKVRIGDMKIEELTASEQEQVLENLSYDNKRRLYE